MKNKKTFIFNEEKEAEKIFFETRDSFSKKTIDYTKMYLIAKYLRQKNNYGAIKLERALIDFCKEKDKNFNPIIERNIIKNWVKSGMGYNLRKIESIPISEQEINFLKTIEILKDRKILFTILVLAKALKKRNSRIKKEKFKTSEHHYIHYCNFVDIITLSGTKNIGEIKLAEILHKYKDYFFFYKPEKELIRLEYVDKFPKNEIYITDFENITDFYNNIFLKNSSPLEKNIKKCVICKKPFSKKSNRQKSCEKCSIILSRERKARWRQKQRDV
jgi:hypothetical protein